MSGDTYRRAWIGNAAQCGCRWERRRAGDVLVECSMHRHATAAAAKKTDRKLAGFAYRCGCRWNASATRIVPCLQHFTDALTKAGAK